MPSVHKPLIRFVGKRVWSRGPAHPHPAAPPEYRKAFSWERNVEQPSSFRDYWDAPARFWRPKHHQLQEFEIDAIQSGGASLH